MDSPRMEQSSSSGSSSAITNPMQAVGGGGGGPAPDDQRAKRPPHLSIDIPAASSVPLTPTAAAEAEAVAATPGSNASRTPGSGSGPGKPPAPQRTPSFMLRQTVRSLLPGGGSFKSSVRGYEASLSRLFSGRIARTASLPAVDHALAASVHAADKTPPSAPAAAADNKTGMHRSQSLPMNIKKLSSAKSIKRMNSLGGVYRVVPSAPRAPAAAAATSNAAPDIVPTEPAAPCRCRRGGGRPRGGHRGGGGGVPDLHGGAVRGGRRHEAGVLLQGRACTGTHRLRTQVVRHQGHQDLRGVQGGGPEPPSHPATRPEHARRRRREPRHRAAIRPVQAVAWDTYPGGHQHPGILLLPGAIAGCA
ncbi:hypothetical protein ACQJBY_013995 [Aegilops geniculata]